jgi:hypothetical protein
MIDPSAKQSIIAPAVDQAEGIVQIWRMINEKTSDPSCAEAGDVQSGLWASGQIVVTYWGDSFY